MNKLYVLIIAVFIAPACYAQIPLNNPIDTTDLELVRSLAFLRSYLGEFSAGHVPDYSKYWDSADCREYKLPDQLVYAITADCPTYRIGLPTVLYAKPENGLVHIKTMFAWVDTNDKISVMSITNHYIKPDKNNVLRFVSPTNIAGKTWHTAVSGHITYHYPPYHVFDKKKAKMLADKVSALQRDWGLQPIDIRYYLADTKEELDHFKGFDFTVAMGNRDKPSGISDDQNNIVYCGGWGEDYFHEVVHIYLNHLYPKSPMREGIAVFYGGSMGHDVAWHLTRLNTYLQQHNEISLDKLDDFSYMDNYTNPYYAITGMLCLNSFKKDGVPGLKRLMAYTSLDELLLKEYGVAKGSWNVFLRKMISEKEPGVTNPVRNQ